MPAEDPVFGKMNRLLHVLNTTDERGLVLSIAAFCEDALGRLLFAFFKDTQSAKDVIEGFNSPLGTLSARIKACHGLGLISDSQFADLEKLRRIRNEFAHNWDLISFETPRVASFIANLNPGRLNTGGSAPAAKVKDCFTAIIIEIELVVSEITKREALKAKSQYMHLQPTDTGSKRARRKKAEAT